VTAEVVEMNNIAQGGHYPAIVVAASPVEMGHGTPCRPD